jgi:AcrR family transcriptional regulator
MSGRKAQAARNDQVILEAARAVFIADPGAPISAVAERARVGISALYRRYASKEDLLRKLCGDGLRRYIAEAEATLADDRDPWTAFADFMRRAVAADTASLTQRLAGTFTPTEEQFRDATRARELNDEIFQRTSDAGVIRPDVTVGDIPMLFEQLAGIQLGDEERSHELRQRYLGVILDGLRNPSQTPLPGQPPGWDELTVRWTPR